jgi:predicted amidophosphoribosyltransferase
MKNCKNCTLELKAEWSFCPQCGEKVSVNENSVYQAVDLNDFPDGMSEYDLRHIGETDTR